MQVLAACLYANRVYVVLTMLTTARYALYWSCHGKLLRA
jgi:hypothetical protein